MININEYIDQLVQHLTAEFGCRLKYIGLQGSYLRSEANPNSDIDIMIVIDDLSSFDLRKYRSILQSMEHYDKSCGFICSTNDLKNWNPLELCNLLHSTKDYLGTLSELLPRYTTDDIRNFIKLSINNLYHEICHRYIHSDEEHNIHCLPASYKVLFFILQNKYYLESGSFISTRSELLKLLSGIDHCVLKKAISITKEPNYNFEEYFECLFSWCQQSLSI